MQDTSDPLRPHAHDPNPTPPSADPSFTLSISGVTYSLTLAELQQRTLHTLDNCFIVSTGHGTSGPFSFGGAVLLDLLNDYAQGRLPVEGSVAVLSGDGFGTRLTLGELRAAIARPPLLAYLIDSRPLRRSEGLVRLIVPSEKDDALRQVKWVSRVELR